MSRKICKKVAKNKDVRQVFKIKIKRKCLKIKVFKVPKHIGEILKPRAKKHSSDSNTNEKNTEFVNLTGEHPEILFTKPTNKEQMQIALEIQKNDNSGKNNFTKERERD